MKIYLLMYIHHDDWHIGGLFDSEEKAQAERVKVRKYIYKNHNIEHNCDRAILFDNMFHWSICGYEINEPLWRKWWY